MNQELELENKTEDIQENYNENITDEEYSGETESDSNYDNSENINILEKPIIQKPKNHTFKWLKDFNGAVNQPFLNHILSNEDNLQDIIDLQLDSLDDDDLLHFIQPVFPKFKEIKSKEDRTDILKIMKYGNGVDLNSTSQHILNLWYEDFIHIGLILDKKERIVGMHSVKHANKLACYLNIKLRTINPTFIDKPIKKKNKPSYTVPILIDKPRAKVAVEMVKYFGARYAKKIYEQGYKYIMACTLDIKGNTNKHNVLVKQVLAKECIIISNKLRNEQSLASDKLESEAFKLSPGFHLKGTGLPRFFEGKITFEENWQYNLVKKFEYI